MRTVTQDQAKPGRGHPQREPADGRRRDEQTEMSEVASCGPPATPFGAALWSICQRISDSEALEARRGRGPLGVRNTGDDR